MANELQGRTVAVLIAPRGTEEPEFTDPRQVIQEAGGTAEALSTEAGEAETVNSDLDPGGSYAVDRVLSDVSADDYDALVIPGGTVGADTLRGSDEAVSFVRSFVDQGKPVAAICHGPWLLVEADVVGGRRLTSYPTLQTDIRNAGGTWTDEEVVIDQGIVTSRTPDDLPAFSTKLIEVVGEREPAAQHA